MRPKDQDRDAIQLPWGILAVVLVWLVWLVLAHFSRVLLDLYTAIAPLRFLGGATPQTLRGTSFAPGGMVAVALLIPILIPTAIAFRTVAKRYRGAPLEALAFTRQNPVWVLAMVVLAAVLLTFLLRFALGWSSYPLPLLEPPAGFFSPIDIILYCVSVPLTALLAGMLVYGFSYPILVARLGVWVGGLICALFFTLPQLAIQGVYWQPAVALLVMGIYLAAVRMRADSAYTATLGYTGFSVYLALSFALSELAAG